MKRAEAFALVRKHGGNPREGVTKKTDVLVVGELGWPLLDDGRPSNSLAQAKSYGIPIASERQFLEWLGKAVPDEQAKTYTADQLASLSKLPARGGRPAFDVRPDRGARAAFTASAISPRRARSRAARAPEHRCRSITRSLQRNPQMAAGRAAVEPASVSGILRPDAGRADATAAPTGPASSCSMSTRRPTMPMRHSPQAQAAEEGGDIATAERLYRRVMKIDPARPGRAFQSRQPAARRTGATSKRRLPIRAAVKADPGYAPAWYNLADMLDEQRRTEEAIECLQARARRRSGLRRCRVQHGAVCCSGWSGTREAARMVAAISQARLQLALGEPRAARAEILRNPARSVRPREATLAAALRNPHSDRRQRKKSLAEYAAQSAISKRPRNRNPPKPKAIPAARVAAQRRRSS